MIMVSFGFLSEPIRLDENRIAVLAVENKVCFRNLVQKLQEEREEQTIVFSEDNQPFGKKEHVKMITDYCDFDFPTVWYKKLYSELAGFCQTEMKEKTAQMSHTVLTFLDELNENFDFDFSYDLEVDLGALFKMQHFEPEQDKNEVMNRLLDHVLLLQKYMPIKCFVFLNLHVFFTAEELEMFFSEMLRRNIPILAIESSIPQERCKSEKWTILDNDLCEIIES